MQTAEVTSHYSAKDNTHSETRGLKSLAAKRVQFVNARCGNYQIGANVVGLGAGEAVVFAHEVARILGDVEDPAKLKQAAELYERHLREDVMQKLPGFTGDLEAFEELLTAPGADGDALRAQVERRRKLTGDSVSACFRFLFGRDVKPLDEAKLVGDAANPLAAESDEAAENLARAFSRGMKPEQRSGK
jgi:hypothetical protein